MPYHEWDDESFDWKSLDAAINMIYDFCWRYGRFSGQAKEKFGLARFYCYFGISLHHLIFPRYFAYKHPKFPNWLWSLDCRYIAPLLDKLIGKYWYKYQHWVYRKAYERAVKKFPHIREEITCAADYPELLKGL